jgi:hypothetical protein
MVSKGGIMEKDNALTEEDITVTENFIKFVAEDIVNNINCVQSQCATCGTKITLKNLYSASNKSGKNKYFCSEKCSDKDDK